MLLLLLQERESKVLSAEADLARRRADLERQQAARMSEAEAAVRRLQVSKLLHYMLHSTGSGKPIQGPTGGSKRATSDRQTDRQTECADRQGMQTGRQRRQCRGCR
jgi:hypothetical protein